MSKLRQLRHGSVLTAWSWVAVSAGCTAPGMPSNWVQDLGYSESEIFPLHIAQFGCPFVDVQIDGQSVRLEFDTGNMSGLAISPQLARQLALPQVGQSTSYDSSGATRGQFHLFRAARFSAFGRSWEDQHVHELADDQISGLIGPKFLTDRRFTVDYASGRIAISTQPLPDAAPNVDILPLVPSKTLKGLLVIEGTVNGRSVLIEVDTGKSRTCVDPELVAELALPESGQGYRIDDIRLGLSTFKVPSAKMIGFKGISRGLNAPILLSIGSDILSRMVWTVDYRSGEFAISR